MSSIKLYYFTRANGNKQPLVRIRQGFMIDGEDIKKVEQMKNKKVKTNTDISTGKTRRAYYKNVKETITATTTVSIKII